MNLVSKVSRVWRGIICLGKDIYSQIVSVKVYPILLLSTPPCTPAFKVTWCFLFLNLSWEYFGKAYQLVSYWLALLQAWSDLVKVLQKADAKKRLDV